MTDSFDSDFKGLSAQEKNRFRMIVKDRFVPDLRSGRWRSGLRVKRYRSEEGVWEMTWATDGRALFMFGDEEVAGETHIIWLRVGSHSILA